MTSTTDVRLVPDTFGRFRYLNESELVEGMAAFMVDIDNISDRENADRLADQIILDPSPTVIRDGQPYVYYHQTRPYWEGQCFVPVVTMTTGCADRDNRDIGGPRHEYWVYARP